MLRASLRNGALFGVRIAPLLALIALSGCYGPPRAALPRTMGTDWAEFVFIRPNVANAALMPVAVGFDQHTRLVLNVGEYAIVRLPAGQYVFFVQTMSTPLHGLPSKPGTLDVVAGSTERLCVLVQADPDNLWRSAVPLLPIFIGHRFELMQVSCPPTDELARLKQVRPHDDN